MTMSISKPDIENKKEHEEGKSWPQIIAILIACLAPLTNGLLFSWTSPFIVKISRDKENYDISEEEASYFTVIPAVMMIVSCMIFSRLNDIIGRKLTILFIAIPHLISWILAAVAKDVWTFYACRAFAGIGDGCLFSSVPMYIGEIATPKVRGVWGNGLTFAIYFGQLLINIIGTYCDVRMTSYICMTFPLIFLVLFSFMPESPYYYAMKGNADKAKATLRSLRRKQDVEKEFESLKADVERQMSESGTWKDLFTIESNRKALYAGIFLRVSQQCSGIAIFTTYTQFIFEKSGGDLNPEISSIIFWSTCCVLNLLASYLLDKIGRRVSYIVSLIFCAILLLIESLYFYLDEFVDSIDMNFLKLIPLTGMMLYILFYSIGLGIVPTLMLGELFSASIKVKGLGFLVIVFGVTITIIPKAFHLLVTHVGLYSPFLVLSIACFVSTVLAFYFVPETSGKTLEEIQQDLRRPQTKENTEKLVKS